MGSNVMPPAHHHFKLKDRMSSFMCSPFLHLSYDVSTVHVGTISRVKFTSHKRLDKMVGRKVENANEIRADIKTRALLSRISTDICIVYGSYSLIYSTLCR